MFQSKKFWIVVIIIFAILNITLVIFAQNIRVWGQKIITNQKPWYAIHLTDNQVYFGHLTVKPDIIKLADVFFLEIIQSNNNEQALQGNNFQIQPSSEKKINLLQWGSGSLSSTDHILFINRSAVLYWEKLSPDSEVVKKIETNLKQENKK